MEQVTFKVLCAHHACDYFKNTPEPQRNNIFINFVIPIILTIAMSISSEIELIQSNKNQIVNSINNIKGHAVLIYAELSGDFPLGDSRQPTYKSLRPFDLVS